MKRRETRAQALTLEVRPENTEKAYEKRQDEFISFCIDRVPPTAARGSPFVVNGEKLVLGWAGL